MGIRIRAVIIRGGSNTANALPIIMFSHRVFNISEVIVIVMLITIVRDSQFHFLLNTIPIKPGRKPDRAALKVKPGKYVPCGLKGNPTRSAKAPVKAP